jgi:dipeptidyl aminopeptidase/acylaminoacyl peptidase
MPAANSILSQDQIEAIAGRLFGMSSLGSPVWIDQTNLAVLDDRSGVPQISFLDTTNGTLTPRTSFPERILSLLGRPGAENLVFGMDTGGNEKQQLWRLSTTSGDPVRLTTNDAVIHEPGAIASDGDTVVYRSNERDEGLFDIYGSSISSFEPSIWMEADGMPHPIAASSEQRTVLVGRLNTNIDASLLHLRPETGEIVDLLPHEGEAALKDAAFGPDGTFVWVVSNYESEFNRLLRIDVATRQIDVVYATDWDVEALAPSPDGKSIAISVNEDGISKVSVLDATLGNVILQLDTEDGVVDRLAWSPDSTKLAFGLSTPTRPGRILVANDDGEITTFDAVPGAAVADLPNPEIIRYTTFDGRDVPAFWFTPPGEGPWPVVIEVHGGPESQRRVAFAPPTLLWLSLGVAVLATNVRGSTGYGKEYCHLDDVEKRLDSVRDLAEAVTWLRSRDDVDPDRISVMGGSYGGFMTLAAVTFHPDLWCAAVDIVGICNFVTFLERTGPWRRKHRAAEYGTLERDRELLAQISPLTHIDKLTAPLFVIHGRNDPRVPLFEAEQVVAALKAKQQEVELMVFDDEGHGLSKRHNRIRGYSAAAAFMLAQFAKPAAAEMQPT